MPTRPGWNSSNNTSDRRCSLTCKIRPIFSKAPPSFFQGHPQLELADEVRPRGAIQYMQGLWPERAELQQGRWPYSDGGEDQTHDGGELEVAVDALGAELLQLDAGDQMVIFPATFFTDPPSMRAKIVGVFRKTNPQDEFWSGTTREFSYQDDRWTMVPLFTTGDALLNEVVALYPPALLDMTLDFPRGPAGYPNSRRGHTTAPSPELWNKT